MAARKHIASGSYRFRLVRNGIELEFEGDRQFVLDLIAQYAHQGGTAETHRAPDKTVDPGKGVQPLPHAGDKSLSIREFIRSFDIKKHTDYVIAFGYFLEKHSGQKNFTPADINNLYYEAKLESSNTSQMLIQNIKRGFVMEEKGGDGGRKRYLLTSSGEQYIEKKRTSAAE